MICFELIVVRYSGLPWVNWQYVGLIPADDMVIAKVTRQYELMSARRRLLMTLTIVPDLREREITLAKESIIT